jgi:fructan beta-fructosidase
MMRKKWMKRILMLAVLVCTGSAGADELLITDFEGGTYGDWKVEGAAFGKGPATANVSPPPNKVVGQQGKGLVNTYLGGDGPIGTLTSPEFNIERKYINFLIGGGNHFGMTCINLLVDGKKVHTATGFNRKDDEGREVLEWATWNVSEFMGQKAVLQIVDNHSGAWGHINVDQIVQSDQPAADEPYVAKLTINKKYLLMPVKSSQDGNNKGAIFQLLQDGTLVREFRVLLPENGQSADWMAFFPVSEFAGETLVLKTRGALADRFSDAAALIRLSDTVPDSRDDYTLPYRDQFHFSTRRGWSNDPNGMVYNDGVYHLYYQYNPFNIGWDNMHWGHATSTDLVHWVEHDIALYPNNMGDMMYSGGGFMDTDNTSGVGKNGAIPQFAAFTSTGRGECLAYSLDGGFAFTELPENPVVKHNGRDPKIIWYKPEQKWVMAVFEITKEMMDPPPMKEVAETIRHGSIAFYSSKNLREWTFESRFVHPDRNAICECPELFEIAVEGRPEETRWILYGAQNRYFIGQFNGREYVAESGPFPGETGWSYAAQTFSDAPDNRRIQMVWARENFYLNRWPNQRFSQGFLVPKEVTLRETPGGLRLFFNPVKEMDRLHGKQLVHLKNPTLAQADAALKACAGKLLDLTVKYDLADGAALRLTVNGQPVSSDGSGSLRVLADRTLTEAFVNGGQKSLAFRRDKKKFDDNTCEIALSGAGSITELVVFEMKSIWENSTAATATGRQSSPGSAHQ